MFYLKKLSLRNFSIHKEFEHTFSGNLTGIVGENGTGKSTIIQGIEWGMRGTIAHKDPIDAFVHCPDVIKHYPMEATLDFEVDGRKGSITRRLTASSASRSLTLEGLTKPGKPLTSDKDVSAAMQQILGAEKSALKGAVFLEQGSLREMFGDAAERRELYTRILGLTEVVKLGGIITTALNKVSASVADFTLQETNLALSLAATSGDIDQLKSELAQHANYSDLVGLLGRRRGQIAIAAAATEKIAELRAAAPVIPTGELRAQMGQHVAARQTLQTKQSEHLAHQAELAGLEQQIALSKSQAQLEDEIRTVESEIAGSLVDATELDSARSLVVELTTLKQRQERKIDIEQQLAIKRKILESRPHEAEATLTQSAERARTALHEAKTNLHEAESMLQMARSLLAVRDQCTKDQCALCGSTDPDYAFVQKSVESWQEKARELAQQVSALQIETNATNTELEAFRREKAEAEAAVRAAENELASLLELLGGDTRDAALLIEPAQAALTDLMARQHRLDSLRASLARQAARRVTCLSVAERSMAELRTIGLRAQILSTEQVLEIESEVQRLSSEIARLEAAIREATETAAAVENLEHEVRGATAMEATLAAQIAAYPAYAAWSAGFLAQLLVCGKNPAYWAETNPGVEMAAAEEHFSNRTQEHARVAGMLEAKVAIRDGLERDLTEVRQKIKSQERRKILVEDLTLARDAFRPTGVLQDYINLRFQDVAARAADVLSLAGNDFVVAPSSTKPLCFDFCRAERGGGWMPHSRMSGGQQMKLAVAVLQALHASLMPGVGFMILDEPSTHLDPRAAVTLATMLQEVSRNGRLQLLVCDHHPALIDTFEDCIRL